MFNLYTFQKHQIWTQNFQSQTSREIFSSIINQIHPKDITPTNPPHLANLHPSSSICTFWAVFLFLKKTPQKINKSLKFTFLPKKLGLCNSDIFLFWAFYLVPTIENIKSQKQTKISHSKNTCRQVFWTRCLKVICSGQACLSTFTLQITQKPRLTSAPSTVTHKFGTSILWGPRNFLFWGPNFGCHALVHNWKQASW